VLGRHVWTMPAIALVLVAAMLGCLGRGRVVHAAGPGASLGVTGNFSEHPGTRLDPVHDTMLITSGASIPQELTLVVEAPAGVAVSLNQPKHVEVAPGDTMVVSVDHIVVASHVAPGRYPLTVRALAPQARSE